MTPQFITLTRPDYGLIEVNVSQICYRAPATKMPGDWMVGVQTVLGLPSGTVYIIESVEEIDSMIEKKKLLSLSQSGVTIPKKAKKA